MITYSLTTLYSEPPTNKIVQVCNIIQSSSGEVLCTYTNRNINLSLADYEELGGASGNEGGNTSMLKYELPLEAPVDIFPRS